MTKSSIPSRPPVYRSRGLLTRLTPYALADSEDAEWFLRVPPTRTIAPDAEGSLQAAKSAKGASLDLGFLGLTR